MGYRATPGCTSLRTQLYDHLLPSNGHHHTSGRADDFCAPGLSGEWRNSGSLSRRTVQSGQGSGRTAKAAGKGNSGAPGEIRTPDLLLRRLSSSPRPSKNQAFILARMRHCAALTASTAHILHTISDSRPPQNPPPPQPKGDRMNPSAFFLNDLAIAQQALARYGTFLATAGGPA